MSDRESVKEYMYKVISGVDVIVWKHLGLDVMQNKTVKSKM